MKFKVGDLIDIEYGTKVKVSITHCEMVGIVVGKATNDIAQSHIVKCTDGTIPNHDYKYDTIICSLFLIETID